MQDLAENRAEFAGMHDDIIDEIDRIKRGAETTNKRVRKSPQAARLPSETGAKPGLLRTIDKRRRGMTEAAIYLQLEINMRALGLSKEACKSALIGVRKVQNSTT